MRSWISRLRPLLGLLGTAGLVIALTPAWGQAQPFAYIATAGDYSPSHACYLGYCPRSTLHVVNTVTGHEVASMTMSDSDTPTAVVVNAAAGYVYVSWNHYPDSLQPAVGYVSIIDTATNVVVRRVNAGTYLWYGSLPDGSAVLVTNGLSDTAGVAPPMLHVISTATGSEILVPTGTDPSAVVVAPDGRTVYVTNAGSNDVTVIDVASWGVRTTIPVGTRPVGLAVSPDGSRLYVANRDSNTISVAATATATVVATILNVAQPGPLAVTSDGTRLVVAGAFGENVVVVDVLQSAVVGTFSTKATSISTDTHQALAYAAEPGALTTLDLDTFQVLRRFKTTTGQTAFGASSGCVFEVGPARSTYGPAGGSGRIDVPAPAGCAWNASPPPAWVTVTSDSSGTGPGVMTYSVAPGSEPRKASIVIAGQPATIAQVVPEMQVDTPPPGPNLYAPFVVSGWALARDVPWPQCYGMPTCTTGVSSVSAVALPSSGGAPVDLGPIEYGLYRCDVAERYGNCFASRATNSGFRSSQLTLPVGDYTIRVTARSEWDAALVETRDVPITVLRTCAHSTVAPLALSVGGGGGSRTVTVTTADTNCGVATVSHADWLTVDGPAVVAESGSARIVAAANPGSDPRSGTVTIAGQTVTVTQEGVPCSYTVTPRDVRAGPSPQGVGIIVVTASAAGCTAWSVATDVDWVRFYGRGSDTAAYWVERLPEGSAARTGTLTIAGSVVTVRQSPQDTFTLDRRTLAFASTGTAWTGPQAVMVNADADVRWQVRTYGNAVQVSPTFGTGSAMLAVSLSDGANMHGEPTAVVQVLDQWVGAKDVIVAVRRGEPSAPPFGLVDTPLQNAANVAGTIGVTGWVLDDVGVAGVQIYRNCLACEPAANCRRVAGREAVFVGDATLVAGARPDVEAPYPTLPQANRAAWGYLLLTNLLPHVPNQQVFGGQGTLTLSALATDVEGKQTWLGRTLGDTTATTITLANDTIAKPFGTIDTPAQGATVSGTLANFGWALTPDVNTTGGEAGDIVVPADGSTLRVYIDGVPGATIAYNQCRGTTVAGPVPPGMWCDDDVASIFGHAAPQATFAPRSSNPTTYRNLDVGRGAIGALLIDTTTLSNGVHTIMWGVTDSAGRGEGLGSRYLTVLNAGADAPATPTPPAGDDGATPAYGLRPTAHGRTAGRADAFEDTPGLIRARVSLDLGAPLDLLPADDAGVRHVRIPNLGRLELDLGGAMERGYLAANGELRDLPPGSHLDSETGIFSWAPGVGYHGTYRLIFVRGDEQCVVDVTIG